MANHTDVKPGQVYRDVKEKAGRDLTVLFVEYQENKQGRFKARYTYATCRTPWNRKVKIDTDRLLSSAYSLVFNPCPVGGGDACPTPVGAASCPQAEP